MAIRRYRARQREMFSSGVETRDEGTLLPIIQKWIEPGTVIVSDCWKAYSNLEKHGQVHRTVKHSKEFVNENGDNTNKIEGHWRQAKCNLPKFGVRKHLFSTYLAEFIWRYVQRNEDLFVAFLNNVKKIYDTNWEQKTKAPIRDTVSGNLCQVFFIL